MAEGILNGDRRFAGCSILVVEDQFLIAEHICALLDELGATVIGPAASVAAALQLMEAHRPDIALLDVNLGEERVYPVADSLTAAGIPFIFMTGYGSHGIEPRYCKQPCIEKPLKAQVMTEMIARLATRREAGTRV